MRKKRGAIYKRECIYAKGGGVYLLVVLVYINGVVLIMIGMLMMTFTLQRIHHIHRHLWHWDYGIQIETIAYLQHNPSLIQES